VASEHLQDLAESVIASGCVQSSERAWLLEPRVVRLSSQTLLEHCLLRGETVQRSPANADADDGPAARHLIVVQWATDSAGVESRGAHLEGGGEGLCMLGLRPIWTERTWRLLEWPSGRNPGRYQKNDRGVEYSQGQKLRGSSVGVFLERRSYLCNAAVVAARSGRPRVVEVASVIQGVFNHLAVMCMKENRDRMEMNTS
jgi:hypothetical protein